MENNFFFALGQHFWVNWKESLRNWNMEHLCFQVSLYMAIHASDFHPHFLISIPASVKECGFQNQTVTIACPVVYLPPCCPHGEKELTISCDLIGLLLQGNNMSEI